MSIAFKSQLGSDQNGMVLSFNMCEAFFFHQIVQKQLNRNCDKEEK